MSIRPPHDPDGKSPCLVTAMSPNEPTFRRGAYTQATGAIREVDRSTRRTGREGGGGRGRGENKGPGRAAAREATVTVSATEPGAK